MTTTVIVRTHSWPAQVRTFPLKDRAVIPEAEWSDPVRIEPHCEMAFCVHDGQDILVEELPREPKG